MYWVLLADQWLMIGLGLFTCVLVNRAQKNTRWLQEVLTPLLAHLVSVVDPNYPKPPDPPPITG